MNIIFYLQLHSNNNNIIPSCIYVTMSLVGECCLAGNKIIRSRTSHNKVRLYFLFSISYTHGYTKSTISLTPLLLLLQLIPLVQNDQNHRDIVSRVSLPNGIVSQVLTTALSIVMFLHACFHKRHDFFRVVDIEQAIAG